MGCALIQIRGNTGTEKNEKGMKTNKLLFVILLIACACGAQLLANTNSGSTLQVELLPLTPSGEKIVLNEELQDQTAEVLRMRLDPESKNNVSVEKDGPNRLIVHFSSDADLAEAKSLITRTGHLEFREAVYNPESETEKWTTKLDGSVISRAHASFDERMGTWTIAIEFTTQGKAEFAKLTKELLGKPLGIFFDGKKLSAPIIQTPIADGKAVITGQFTEKEAKELSRHLDAGGLPVKVKLVQPKE